MEPLRPGDPREIGTYRLEARLGSGGMGEVFLGRSRGGRPVAVKLIRRELAGDARFRRRFAREVANARKVGGVYTAEVIDAAPDADPPWLVTAYVAGPSLRTAVDRGDPLPPEAIAPLGAALAEGLAAVHAANVVHGDLTPGNVILAADGPRLIDFGIAHALDATTVSVTVAGTPGFMSPEQARGLDLDPRSDVFSLGAVLAYAATGRSPFGTGRAEAVIYRIVHDEPDLTGVPPELAGLLASCLAKDPAARPRLPDLLNHLAGLAEGPPDWTVFDKAAAEETVRVGAAERPDDEPTERMGGGDTKKFPPPGPTKVAPESQSFTIDRLRVRGDFTKLGALWPAVFCGCLDLLVVVLLISDYVKSDGASSDDIVPVLSFFFGLTAVLTVAGALIGRAIAPRRPPTLTLDAGGLEVTGERRTLTLGWDEMVHVSTDRGALIAWFRKDDPAARRLRREHRLRTHPGDMFPGEGLTGHVVYNAAPGGINPDQHPSVPRLRAALPRLAGGTYAVHRPKPS